MIFSLDNKWKSFLCKDFPKQRTLLISVLRLTRSLASIFCPPRNHSTAMSSYDSSHSKVAVSPAVTVTSFRGRISPMDRAEQEEDMVNREASTGLATGPPELIWGLFHVRKFVKHQRVVLLLLHSENSLPL